jgi:hypothetical protein
MSDKEMPKEVSIMGGCPVPNLCSPLLFLAELEAEGKAKKARLRSQKKRWAMAKRAKKGFEEIARAVCYLRRRAKKAGGDSQRLEVCRPALRRSHLPVEMGGRTHGPKSAR